MNSGGGGEGDLSLFCRVGLGTKSPQSAARWQHALKVFNDLLILLHGSSAERVNLRSILALSAGVPACFFSYGLSIWNFNDIGNEAAILKQKKVSSIHIRFLAWFFYVQRLN